MSRSSGFLTNSYTHSPPPPPPPPPHSCYTLHQSNSPSCDHFNYIWRTVQFLKFFTMQFSPAACYLILLRSIYSPQCPFLKQPILLMTEAKFHILQNYRQNYSPLSFNFYVFRQLTRREKKSELNDSKHYPNLICS
jgi:hypothetical protein